MKRTKILFGSLFLSATLSASIAAHAEDVVVGTNGDGFTDPMAVCLFTGLPNESANYEVIRRVKLGKGSYGGVADILPAFAAKTQNMGGNAVINYIGSQRFGFWPWRIVRPIVRGEAVKMNIEPGQSCMDLGGASVADVIATNKEPHMIEQQEQQ